VAVAVAVADERGAGESGADSARPGRWLLAIDSSTERAGVALSDGEHLAETLWHAGRTQTITVLPEIDRLLNLAGIALPDVAAIAVATGPGTFNGLRVGLSVAKGLCLAHGARLLGVPTLDVAALPFAGPAPVVAVLAAGRGRLVWAAYEETADGWGQTRPPHNGRPAELTAELTALPDGALVTGELIDDLAAELATIPGVRLPLAPLRVRRPAALVALAWPRFVAADFDDAAGLEPVYLHGR
jgi:tRNA threonylcarbamoyladenosine biosynthesis protein TsaB